MKKTPGSLSRDIFLSVGRSFIFIFVPVAALLIFILMIFYEKEHKNRSALLQNHEKDGVSVIFYQLSSDFRFILSDLNIILEHAELKKITEKGLTEDSKDALALELLAFSRNRKLYDQIRLFHTTGSEVIRVSYNRGSPIIAPEKELESETKNTFILETSHIKRGEINVSPLGIIIENKAAGESPEAVISFGAPLFDSRGHKRGIVIFDFKGENLLTHFSNAPAGARGQKMLLNTEGYWLKAPQKEDEWGFVFADRKDRTFGKRYPDSWKKIEENESGQFSNRFGLFTFSTFFPLRECMKACGIRNGVHQDAGSYYWKIVSFVPQAILDKESHDAAGKLLSLGMILLILLAVLSLYLARTLVLRKIAQEDLRESEERFRDIFNNSPYGIVLADPATGMFCMINRTMQRMTGYSREELESASMGAPSPEDGIYQALGIYDALVHMEPAPQDFTNIPLKLKSGAIIYADISTAWFALGGRKYIAGFFRDVTERLNAEIELRRHREHLEELVRARTAELEKEIAERERMHSQLLQSQKMEAIGALAGGVAHDFNNQLTAILGFGELLLLELEPNDPVRESIDEMVRAGKAAGSLTGQLLAFSRRQMLQPRIIQVNELIANMIKMLRRLIGEDIEIVIIPDPETSFIKVDPSQLEQVLINLIINARDAMPQGGRLIIRTENAYIDENKGGCQEVHPGAYARISIEDTGSGMDRETVRRIFEPFFTTKETGRGTGLGLSVVYGIVKQHEGFVDVRSSPGKGSSFSVYLPYAPGITEAGEKEEKVTLDGLQGDGERILLVEDDEGARRIALKIAVKNGYVVFEAKNASEAREIFERESGDFHLVVSDVVLPDKSGPLIIEQMLEQKPDLKVLFASGYSDHRSQWNIISEKGFPFIQKPYRVHELLKGIKEAMNNGLAGS